MNCQFVVRDVGEPYTSEGELVQEFEICGAPAIKQVLQGWHGYSGLWICQLHLDEYKRTHPEDTRV